MQMVGGDGVVLTLAAAREHLRITDEASDVEVASLIAAAEAAIVDELGRDELVGPSGWATAEAVPGNVVHAVKLVLADLYDNRATPRADVGPVQRLIGRWVVPSVA